MKVIRSSDAKNLLQTMQTGEKNK